MESHSEKSIFINPFTDFGFKKIFGEEPNKDLLIDFLNELLREQNVTIKTLTYKKTERLGVSDIDRNVVFDLYCENEEGEKFIVEMQKAKQSFFKDRTLFYSTFPIQDQGIKGEGWNYKLKAVFAVAILDFTFDDADRDKPIVNRVQLMDRKSCKVFYDKLTYVFVQMPNFNKDIDQLETHLDKWFYVLKNLNKFDRIPEKIKDKIFQKVFKIAQYHKLTKEDRQAYEESLKYYRDLKNSLDTANQEGYIRAENQYRPLVEKANQQKEQALYEKEQALLREKAAMQKLAGKMKKLGEPMDTIIKETGLSAKEIEGL
ncbi:MAG: Rpn family recombination-promoting nuclease/putative transposase [Bacteroidetes bacterium]|nr:MAG: Rpn family recombination-promoting nuclease/putative transposase [Bacteroidota bacterium]